MAGVKESVLTFGPSGGMVGVLSRPPGWEPGAAPGIAVLLLNSGVIHRVGPNRLHVELARTLALRGTPCFRVDLPGIGDSRPLGTGGALLAEWVQGARTAMDVLEQRGVATRFVLFGLCSGADRAFSTAAADPRVVGMALVDPTGIFPTWQSKVLKRLRWLQRPAWWKRLVTGRYRLTERVGRRLRGRRGEPANGAPPVSARPTLEEGKKLAEEALRGLVRRGVRMCYIITASEEHRYNYRRQLFDAFPALGLEELVQVEMFSRSEHTFPRAADRTLLQDTVAEWLERVAGGPFPPKVPQGAGAGGGGEDAAG